MKQEIKHIMKLTMAFVVLMTFQVHAQTPISLEKAYETAFENNLSIKAGKLRVDYQSKIKKSFAVVDPVQVSGEIGQINSAYTDNKFSVEQTLKLPRFYKSHQKVLLEEWKNSLLNLEVQKWKLKREIALIYNELNYLQEKEKLLQVTDTIYANYYKRAELRLKKGESNILEKTTAENYRSHAQIQLANLKKDREITLHQFNYLLNDGVLYTNETSEFYEMTLVKNELQRGNSPVLEQLEQQKNIEAAKFNAEKSKLLPTFILGYNNSGMFGNGADNNFYGRSARFHSGMIGVGIPLFNGAQKSVVEGQKINQLIAENNYEFGASQLKNQYSTAFSNYEKLKTETAYYKNNGLKNAQTILKTANRLYIEGEINFLEWSLLIHQSLDVQNKLVDTQKLLNEQIIELNHLTDIALKTN